MNAAAAVCGHANAAAAVGARQITLAAALRNTGLVGCNKRARSSQLDIKFVCQAKMRNVVRSTLMGSPNRRNNSDNPSPRREFGCRPPRPRSDPDHGGLVGWTIGRTD